MKLFMLRERFDNGYAMLFAVIIIGAVGLVALLVLWRGANFTSLLARMTTNDLQARHAAEACAEIALDGLRQNENYTWGGQIGVGSSSCNAVLLGTGNANREIQAIGQTNGVLKRVQVKVSSLWPQVNIQSWREVSGFN